MRNVLCALCLVLGFWTVGAVELAVPGKGWRKVRLVYEARVTDDATYEAHPEYEAMPRLASSATTGLKTRSETMSSSSFVMTGAGE